jgi:hypothetical protein
VPLTKDNIWFSSIYNKEEVENLKNLLLEEFNRLYESTNLVKIISNTRRFLYTLFDLFVRRFDKRDKVVIKQFQEVYIRNIDLRYRYGKVDMIIGDCYGIGYTEMNKNTKSFHHISTKSFNSNTMRMRKSLSQWTRK